MVLYGAHNVLFHDGKVRYVCLSISIPYSDCDVDALLEVLLPNSLRVVKALTGERPLTARANLITRWLRRMPVARCDVRFFGLPIYETTPSLKH